MARTPARPDGATWNRLPPEAVPFSGRFRRHVQGGSVQDVRLGDLDRVESEQANRLDQDRRAGDDRRGAVGVEARYPLALLERDRGEFAEHAVAGSEQQAVTV